MSIVAFDKDHCLALRPRFTVQVWMDTLPAAVDDNIDKLTPWVATQSGPIAHLVVVDTRGNPPSKEARARLEALASVLAPHTTVIAYAYEGDGFKGAAIRAVMTALALLASRKYPVKICATLPAALAFITEHVDDDPGYGSAKERATLAVEAIKAMRSAVGQV